MKILVVGAGNAGLISALILKTFLDSEVDIVYSENIGTVGVGEGSTEHFSDFMRFVGIDYFSIIKECDATFKSAILFENWSKNSYLHNVGPPFNEKAAQYRFVYAKQISEKSSYIDSKLLYQNKINSWFINKPDSPPFNQYHFNTEKLNLFLIKKAKSIGIKTFIDDVQDISMDNEGNIINVIGKKNIYKYDFYIDATGFKKMLIGKMGAKWISSSKYLKMNSAIVFQTGDENEYNMWTLAKAMNYGWRFKIPVWGRHGNGYIYNSDFLSLENAKKEIDDELGYNVEISKSFKFDPGYLDRPWIKNCVAIGLSSNFFEPLEATSIGSTIQQSFLLMHSIANYKQSDIDIYNKNFITIMENIRDFIALHYIVDKDNSDFWKEIKTSEIPDSLSEKLSVWKNRLPKEEDFKNYSRYSMFFDQNFISVMHGLNLFNSEEIKKEYYGINKEIRLYADNIIKNNIDFENSIETIGHKEFINMTRKYFVSR